MILLLWDWLGIKFGADLRFEEKESRAKNIKGFKIKNNLHIPLSGKGQSCKAA